MTLSDLSPRRTALAAAFVLAIYNLAPLAMGPDALLARVPDDAFYYLVLCKNFAAEGRWTFDGQHPASGFHILFGYLVAGLYWLAPGLRLEAAYAIIVVLNTALVGCAVLMLAQVNERLGFGRGNFALLLVAISSVALRLPGFPMESALVVFFSAAAFHLAVHPRSGGAGTCLLAFGVGVLGVLARSDWGALPFALLVAAVVQGWYRGAFDKAALRVLAVMLAGAAAGEVVVALHTYAFTGGFMQRSASIKHFWATIQGYSALPGLARVAELAGPFVVPRPVTLVLLAVVAGLVVIRGHVPRLLHSPLPLAALFILAGYLAVYMLNGSVQFWYAASFFAAVALLASAALALLGPWSETLQRGVLAVFLASAAYQLATPPWPWAPSVAAAGRHLAAHPELTPVGAFNAGILAYFAGRPVINLDGLVNDDVYPYVVGGKLHTYLADRGIRYIVDFPTVLQGPLAIRGGIVGTSLSDCAQPVATFAPSATFEGVPITAFAMDRDCLIQAGADRGGAR